jgi:aryl carrier-like protein
MIIDMGEWTWTKGIDQVRLMQLREWLREEGGSETVQLRMQATILRRHQQKYLNALGRTDPSPEADQERVALDLLEAHLKATW